MKGIPLNLNFLRTRKGLVILANDIFWSLCSYFLAYFLRFNFSIPGEYFSVILKSLPLLVFFRSISFYLFGLYTGVLRYASIDDLLRIIKAVTVGSLLFISIIAFVFHLMGFPRSVFLIDWFVIVVFLGGSRFMYRIFK
jgi:FlaA1/EpsC-like NDP-sugar epimerase